MFDIKDKGYGVSLLKYFCDASDGQIAEIFNATLDSKGNIFVPSENDSKVLFVAHRDVVTDRPRFEILPDKNTIINSKLDDRLGIYAAYLLKYKYKLDFDILLTTDEEKCNSTSQFFKSDKQYNWMFQFDRAGSGHVVSYQYENVESEKLLNSVGLRLDMGSYSDICELGHLGCIGFNFAVAYYKQHSPNCFMKIDEFKNQVRKFMKFFELYKDQAMPFSQDQYELTIRARHESYGYGIKTHGVSALYDDEYYDWYYGKHTSQQTQAIAQHENEKLINNKLNDNENFWEEAAYLKNYKNNKHTVVRKARGNTKITDFRTEQQKNYAQEMEEFQAENDKQLNEMFGGVVEKNGVMVNIKWKGGVAFYEPLPEKVGMEKPEVGSYNWFKQANSIDFDTEMQLANQELDRQMQYAVDKEI